MTATVEQYTVAGQLVTCIQTEYGNFLYEQKRILTPTGWTKMVINGLLRAGFSREDVKSHLPSLVTHENYFNRHFYKPVSEMVQREIELSC